MEMKANQSFNVDDIRRIREEADVRYQSMTPDEISKDIRKGAEVGYQIIAKIKSDKSKEPAMQF